MREDTVMLDTSGSDDHAQLNRAQHLLDNMQLQIRAADEKVSVLFSGSALLAAALAFDTQQSLSRLQPDGLSPHDVAVLGARVLVMLAVAAAVASAIAALLPRVRAQQAERSLVFFGHIVAAGHDAFIDEVRMLPTDVLVRQTLSQVHVTAQIVATKYTWIRRAATAFMLAVVFLIVLRSLALLA